MSLSCEGGQFVSKYTFRQVPLSTWILKVLIESRMRNVKGVYPADVYPQLKVDSDKVFKAKWIWNTDTSNKLGTHWILCSYTRRVLSEVGCHKVFCHVYDYEILTLGDCCIAMMWWLTL